MDFLPLGPVWAVFDFDFVSMRFSSPPVLSPFPTVLCFAVSLFVPAPAVSVTCVSLSAIMRRDEIKEAVSLPLWNPQFQRIMSLTLSSLPPLALANQMTGIFGLNTPRDGILTPFSSVVS